MKRLLRRTACTVGNSMEHLTPDPLHEEREPGTDTGLPSVLLLFSIIPDPVTCRDFEGSAPYSVLV